MKLALDIREEKDVSVTDIYTFLAEFEVSGYTPEAIILTFDQLAPLTEEAMDKTDLDNLLNDSDARKSIRFLSMEVIIDD